MKDKLLLIRNQLKMGHRLSFAEAMLLQRAIDILVYGAGNASAQSPIDHGYRPECECSGCKATARICTELAGNSPVIPDGYVLVPLKPTKEMLQASENERGADWQYSVDIWDSMCRAAMLNGGKS